MTPTLPQDALALVKPARLFTWADIVADRTLVPRGPGVYAWYFDEVPPGVPAELCEKSHGATLLYIGIAPKAPPANLKPPSKATLRSRLRQHFRLNAAGSTLRLTLGCLLGLELRRVGSGKRLTFSAGEQHLSQWIAAHGRVCWVETAEPWVLEHVIIPAVNLPLNLDQNRNHRFHSELSAIRARARECALRNPILPR